jgi:hypothetical protein
MFYVWLSVWAVVALVALFAPALKPTPAVVAARLWTLLVLIGGVCALPFAPFIGERAWWIVPIVPAIMAAFWLCGFVTERRGKGAGQ